jgi:hypothetical protein
MLSQPYHLSRQHDMRFLRNLKHSKHKITCAFLQAVRWLQMNPLTSVLVKYSAFGLWAEKLSEIVGATSARCTALYMTTCHHDINVDVQFSKLVLP